MFINPNERMKKLSWLLFLTVTATFSIGYAFWDSQICIFNSSNAEPSLSTEELEFISKFNQFIEVISIPLTPEELDEKFHASGGEISSATHIFLGETHSHLSSIIDQARALQTLFEGGDRLFVEGDLHDEIYDCDSLIYNRYIKSQTLDGYDRLQDPDESEWKKLEEKTLELSRRLYPIFEKTEGYLNLHKLSLHGAVCIGWDASQTDIDNTEAEKGLQAANFMRNSLLVSTLEKFEPSSEERAFVIAGNYHLPTGDLKLFKDWVSSLPEETARFYGVSNVRPEAISLPDYYRTIEKLEDNPEFFDRRDRSTLGSTAIIWDYLRNVDYVELIPKSYMARKYGKGA